MLTKKPRLIDHSKFYNFPLDKALEKQVKAIEEQGKTI